MKTRFLLVLFFGVVLVLGAMACWFPLVLHLRQKPEADPVVLEQSGVNPLSKLNFESGVWVAYLHVDTGDFSKLPSDFPRFPCLVAADISVLRKMMLGWNMRSQGGDVATVTSTISIFKDGKLQFEAGIVLESNHMGLQHPSYGWMTPSNGEEFLAPLKEFKKLHRPLILL